LITIASLRTTMRAASHRHARRRAKTLGCAEYDAGVLEDDQQGRGRAHRRRDRGARCKRDLDKLNPAHTPIVVLAIEAHETGLLFVDKLLERLCQFIHSQITAWTLVARITFDLSCKE
jgi:hypothetical protein